MERSRRWRGTYCSRVVHQSRRVPGDRWTPGSMERPHNWENSAGLLVGRTHGHLSCRDRPAIDGSPRFELTPVKSCVARCHGKSRRTPLIDTGYYFPLVTRPFYQLSRGSKLRTQRPDESVKLRCYWDLSQSARLKIPRFFHPFSHFWIFFFFNEYTASVHAILCFHEHIVKVCGIAHTCI